MISTWDQRYRKGTRRFSIHSCIGPHGPDLVAYRRLQQVPEEAYAMILAQANSEVPFHSPPLRFAGVYFGETIPNTRR